MTSHAPCISSSLASLRLLLLLTGLSVACDQHDRAGEVMTVAAPAVEVSPVLRAQVAVPGSAVWAPGERRVVALELQREDGRVEVAAQRVRWRALGDAARVDEAGRVEAVRAGQAEIVGEVIGDGARVGRAVVTVREGQAEALAITPGRSLARVGEVLDLYPEARWADGARVDARSAVMWQVEGDAARVDEAGRLVAVRAGQARVWAEAFGLRASAEVEVLAGAPERLDVWPCAQQVPVGARVQAQGVLRFDGGSAEAGARVSWWSSNPGVARVDARGIIEVLAAGTAVIVGEVDGLVGQTTIEGRVVEDAALSLLPGEVWLAPGQLAQLSVRAVLPARGGQARDTILEIGRGCDWSVDDTSIAQVGAATGVPGQLAAYRPGTTVVHARCLGQRLKLPIVVSEAAPQGLSIEPPALRVPVGATYPLEALATHAQRDRLVTAQAAWTSDAPEILEVANAPKWRGFVTARTPGVATISAALGSQQASLTIEVFDARLEAIDLTPEAASFRVGELSQYSATGYYSDGSSFYISRLTEWTSDAPQRGRLDASRVGRGTLCATQPGALVVRASMDGVTGQAEAEVRGQIAALEVSGPTSPAAGQAAQLTATMVLDDGTRHNVTGQVAWSSEAPEVIDVSAQGVARAQQPGLALIRATLPGATQAVSGTRLWRVMSR